MSYYTDCVSLCDIDEIDGTDRANDEERNVLENIYNHWFFTYSKIFLHCPKRYICDTCFPQSSSIQNKLSDSKHLHSYCFLQANVVFFGSEGRRVGR